MMKYWKRERLADVVVRLICCIALLIMSGLGVALSAGTSTASFASDGITYSLPN